MSSRFALRRDTRDIGREPRSQRHSRIIQPRLDGADWALHNLSNFVVRHPLHIIKYHHRAQLLRQAGKRTIEFAPQLPIQVDSLRVVPAVWNLSICLAVVGFNQKEFWLTPFTNFPFTDSLITPSTQTTS